MKFIKISIERRLEEFIEGLGNILVVMFIIKYWKNNKLLTDIYICMNI